MRKNQKNKLFFLILLFFLISAVNFAKADAPLEASYPSVPNATTPTTINTSIADYVKYIFYFAIAAAGIIAIAALIYGGILYLTSTGKADRTAKARDQISGAILGILILLSSWLIFSVINPSIANINITALPGVSSINVPTVSPEPESQLFSLIDTQLPFGTLIEDILQTIAPPNTTAKPRMDRLKDIGENSITLANKLKDNASKLKSDSGNCKCDDATPVCEDATCEAQVSCTCDVCKTARADIQDTEKLNFDIISNGTTISSPQNASSTTSTVTSIVAEQNKATEEIRSLGEGLTRLNRLVNVIQNCPLLASASYSEFLNNKTLYVNNGWYLTGNYFWQNIIIDPDRERATFYCPVSGTETSQETITQIAQTDNEQLLGINTSAITGCKTEVPIGEIYDQVQRIVNKIITRLQGIIDTDAKLMAAVDKLQTLVSQCTSQNPRCRSICTRDNYGHCEPIKCAGTPCDDSGIQQQNDKVSTIAQQINDLVKKPLPTPIDFANMPTNIEDVGLEPIASEIVPNILIDLDKRIRSPMAWCGSQGTPGTGLLNCASAIDQIGPNGQPIKYCINEAPASKAQNSATNYLDQCYNQCYLISGINTQGQVSAASATYLYQECLGQCLAQKSQTATPPDDKIKEFTDQLNFYCCSNQ